MTIDLAKVDMARVELVSDAVTLWAMDGHSVTCTDVVGDNCVVSERPGEHISVPASIDGVTYLQAFKDKLADCQ